MSADMRQNYFTREAIDLCEKLTAREAEALVLLAKGLGYKEAGRHMGISRGTVEVHAGNIAKKLGVSRVIESAVIAAKAGLV